MTKLSGNLFDLIVVYKGPTGNDGILREHLKHIINCNRDTIVVGDFNMCFVENRNNRSSKFLTQNRFKQMVKHATHIEGG